MGGIVELPSKYRVFLRETSGSSFELTENKLLGILNYS